MEYVANDILGLQMAQVTFAPRPRNIWVDCIGCGRRDRLAGDDTERMSDNHAAKLFRSRGWSIKPTRCPGCRSLPERNE